MKDLRLIGQRALSLAVVLLAGMLLAISCGTPEDPTNGNGPSWIEGFWVNLKDEPVSSPGTDVYDYGEGGSFTIYDDYAMSEVLESGTWSLEGDVLTVTGVPFPPMEVTQVDNDQFAIPSIGQTYYRRETEPNVFDQAETVLTSGVWTDGSLPEHGLKLHSFTASLAGDYDIFWDEGGGSGSYDAELEVSAYKTDQATPFFVRDEMDGYATPRTVALGAGEKIFVIAITVGGTFSVMVQPSE